MNIVEKLGGAQAVSDAAKKKFSDERSLKRLDGWFICREIAMECDNETEKLPLSEKAAYRLYKIAQKLPLSIEDTAVFAGTQRDAFARSYALINPSFKVESFGGYCDPTAVYGDIEPNETFTKDRIDKVKKWEGSSEYVRKLREAYSEAENYTDEVVYFMEQVTGHVIADFRGILKYGINSIIADIENKKPDNNEQESEYKAMKTALEAVLVLAGRYSALAAKLAEKADESNRSRLLLISETLSKVPAQPAESLYEAIQAFIIVWQAVCL